MVELGAVALDRAFYALADPTRRDIVKRLCKDELRIVDLASEYDATLMNTCKHVKVLESAGLISIRKEGKTSWCRFNPQGIKSISETVKFYEQFWSHQLDSLKELAEQMEKEGNSDGNSNHKRNRRKT